MKTIDILKALCIEHGISGRESGLFSTVQSLLEEIAEVRQMENGNIIAEIGNCESDYHIMLDAHIDRIGLVVTYIDDNGFIKAEPVGGIDLRTLPSSTVVVNDDLLGIVCTMPPHIDKGDGELSRDAIWVDTGLPADRVKQLVRLGDSIIVKSKFAELLNNRVTVSALDNRAGCAALIKCAYLLKDRELPCKVSLVFSVQEETNESGAKTAAFELAPDEAVIVDVGFAKQDGVPNEKSGAVGCGAVISIAPVLSGKVTDRLIRISEELGMECDYEVDGGGTGTNADGIAVSRGGVPCGVLSVPEKNMHTQTETVCIDDIEAVANILSVYVAGEGIKNA